jgi:hypothetical protein
MLKRTWPPPVTFEAAIQVNVSFRVMSKHTAKTDDSLSVPKTRLYLDHPEQQKARAAGPLLLRRSSSRPSSRWNLSRPLASSAPEGSPLA